MRSLTLALSLLLALPVSAYASPDSLTKAAKEGKSVEFVMQQAKEEGTPVESLLAELVKAGVVNAGNIKDAVAAATRADPARVGAIVTVALTNFIATLQKDKRAVSQAANILKAANANAPDQAAQIASSAKSAGISDKVVAAAQAAAKSDAEKGLNKTSSSNNISVAPFSTPNAGGGGGGSASPN